MPIKGFPPSPEATEDKEKKWMGFRRRRWLWRDKLGKRERTFPEKVFPSSPSPLSTFIPGHLAYGFGGGKAVHKGYEGEFGSAVQQYLAFVGVERFYGVVAAFDVNIGL